MAQVNWQFVIKNPGCYRSYNEKDVLVVNINSKHLFEISNNQIRPTTIRSFLDSTLWESCDCPVIINGKPWVENNTLYSYREILENRFKEPDGWFEVFQSSHTKYLQMSTTSYGVQVTHDGKIYGANLSGDGWANYIYRKCDSPVIMKK